MEFLKLQVTNIGSPLEQFNCVPLIKSGINYDFTTSSLFILIGIIIIFAVFHFALKTQTAKGNNSGSIIPSRLQSMVEIFYSQTTDMVKNNLPSQGGSYFPFIFTIFIFIFILNLTGLIPYTYSVTAQVVIAFGLSISIWWGVALAGLIKQGSNYAAHFFPMGAPLPLAPLLVIIELVSYCVRALSLGIRLSANITAGHLLFGILSTFSFKLLTAGLGGALIGLIPFSVIYILFGLELATCLIQAYVFSLLTTIYLSESVEAH